MVVAWVTLTASPATTGAKGSWPSLRSRPRKSGPGSSPGAKRGKGIQGGHPSGVPPGYLLAALLDIGAHEFLGVLVEHLVDLVEQLVEFGLQLVALLCRRGCSLLGLGVRPAGGLSLDLFSFSHVGHAPSRCRAGRAARWGSHNPLTTH